VAKNISITTVTDSLIMTNSLPTITTKQQEILKLIYRYRFLNRTQIQTILGHKDKRRIISWLKDLRDKQYVDWHYDATDFIAKSKPGIYYLSLNGTRYLRGLNHYPSQELRKRYKEPERTQTFIDRCLLTADCCITLRDSSKDGVEYSYILPADYVGLDNEYSFLDELRPQLYFSKRKDDGNTSYLLESFDATLPRYQLRKRLKDYMDFLDELSETNKPYPIALFVCATTADLLYVKRRMKKSIEDEDGAMQVRVTTLDKIKASGVASTIWEEV